ncbi:MAG: aminoacyl-tRNA hydrolase [bacterium]|nr:aminoacyl-tRNA hydrolase [bacterium]
MDDLRVNNELLIPAAELKWKFDPSGGPGGQHANKSATRVELSWNVQMSPVLDERSRSRIRGGVEVDDRGVVSVQVGESRSQWRNRQIARRRLAAMIEVALRPPPSRRRATKPTHASRERRLASKRARSETKRMRQRPRDFD